MNFEFAESFVMIGCIINNAIALINETLGATIICGVINIGFMIGTLGQCCMIVIIVIGCVVVEFVSANHHTDGCPRVKIPLFKCLACFRFVKFLGFVFADIISWQLVKLAQVRSDGIAGGVLSGFLDSVIDICAISTIDTIYIK